MKIPRFSNAIGNLDEDLVEAAAECKKKQNHLLKLGSIAACFAVTAVYNTVNCYFSVFIKNGLIFPWPYNS